MRATLNRFANGLKNYLSPPPVPLMSAADELREKSAFNDVQRHLRIYLRALWECDFSINHANVDDVGDEVGKPFIEYFVINLPAVYYDTAPEVGPPVSGREIYRAAATHAAAHLMYRKKHLSSRSLTKLQIAMISLVEDARVEALAFRRFPGLKSLWAGQHIATPQQDKTAGDFINRLARTLLDERYRDDDAWVAQGRALFDAVDDLEDERISRDIGIELAASFREKKISFDFRTDTQSAPYRDDNRYLWRRQGVPLEITSPFLRSMATVGIEEGDKDRKNRPVQAPEVSANKKPVSATYVYPEWNYRSRSEDRSWVTLREREPVSGDLKIIDKIVAENLHLISRMKSILRAIRDGAPHRHRKLEEGDEIDINAAIRAQIDLRQGIPPDPRIMMRSARKSRDTSVLMLLDLSRSMNNKVQDREHTAMELTRQVSVLFAEALEAVGDPYAIHGFYSDSRHFVEYFRFKNFEQPYDDVPKAAMAGMTGKRGTRMGAAIRHATHHLNNQKSSKKLLLIMTDGEPSDIDAPDRKYLHDDTKKSVEDAKRSGIHSYCISLDPAADQYVARIFGAMNYIVVDHVKHLPEKVLSIYAGLSR